jgi:hydroxyethylthiazole kinase-like uncharacterized protein yjeF
MVPGALRLTGEAALRVGAGKLQMATIASAAMGLGLLVPEAAVLALNEDVDGEIAGDPSARLDNALNACDTLVIGPGIGSPEAATAALRLALADPRDDMTLVIDAMAIGCAKDLRDALGPFQGRLILTPHHGEMAMLTGLTEDRVAEAPDEIARSVAADYGAIVVLKARETLIADPDGTVLHYGGGGTGLATGGSGDVLAGAIAGLSSRGTPPLVAAGWGVWLHGQSGRRVATTTGPIGFLAREVPEEFPRLLPQ